MSIVSSTGQIYTITSNSAVLNASSTALFGIAFSVSPHTRYVSFQSPPSPTLNSSASGVCQSCLRSWFSFYLTALASPPLPNSPPNWDVTSRHHCSFAQYKLAVIISSACYVSTVSNDCGRSTRHYTNLVCGSSQVAMISHFQHVTGKHRVNKFPFWKEDCFLCTSFKVLLKTRKNKTM